MVTGVIERRVYAMRMQASLIPAQDSGNISRIDFPEVVTDELNREGWRVVDHTISVPDLSGDMLLTLYVER